MNETAKNLREAANYMADSGANSAHAIATVRGLFDVVESDTFGGDLGRVLNVIADELDELQARAAGANNLRQQLESVEDKAERRKKHIGYLGTALHDKNALLEQRGGTIARLTAENGKLRKQVPTERERQILAMWPRFEDGEPVMIGDEVDGLGGEIIEVYIAEDAADIWNNYGNHMNLSLGERVNRPAPKVLDAEGVEINVGDKVWLLNGIDNELVVEEIDDESGWVRTRSANGGCLSVYNTHLTHIAPDSWERLEEDAELNDETGIVGGNLDIVRRAKALAEAEVGR